MIAYEILQEKYWGKWKVSKRISLYRRLLLFSINLSTFLKVIEIKKKQRLVAHLWNPSPTILYYYYYYYFILVRIL